MNPPWYPASPARLRRKFSRGLSGQVKPVYATKAPYTTAGRCAQRIRRQLQARKTPPTTRLMNSKWTATTRSAAMRYHILSPSGRHTSSQHKTIGAAQPETSRARRETRGEAGKPAQQANSLALLGSHHPHVAA